MSILLAHYFGAQEALSIATTMNPSEIMARRENVTKRIEQFAAESKASGQVERYFHVINSQRLSQWISIVLLGGCRAATVSLLRCAIQ